MLLGGGAGRSDAPPPGPPRGSSSARSGRGRRRRGRCTPSIRPVAERLPRPAEERAPARRSRRPAPRARGTSASWRIWRNPNSAGAPRGTVRFTANSISTGAFAPVASDLRRAARSGASGNASVLEDWGEGHDAHARARDAVVDGVVLGRVRRAHGGERPVGLGRAEVEPRLARVSAGVPAGQVERPELALRASRGRRRPRRNAGRAGERAGRSARSVSPSTTVFPKPSATAAMPSAAVIGGAG